MRFIFALLFILIPIDADAQDRLIKLYAPEKLTETGLLKFALPRFSLKTQVKVELVSEPTAADFTFGSEGTPVFEGLGSTWSVTMTDSPATTKLMAWVRSDVGKRTIFGFAPNNGAPLFSEVIAQDVEVAAVEITGDALLGKEVSRQSCARCHAVDEETRMTTIGSTPSFFVLRTFEDWEYRFSAFYALKPHGAFTQIEELTEPFPVDRPSPIVPIELTLDDVEAILAYVAVLTPANLGSPIKHQ